MRSPENRVVAVNIIFLSQIKSIKVANTSTKSYHGYRSMGLTRQTEMKNQQFCLRLSETDESGFFNL